MHMLFLVPVTLYAATFDQAPKARDAFNA
jgi:hypothetical protein